MKRLLCLLLLIMPGLNPALAASFNCAKAGATVEKMICADAELSRYDELLGSFYGALVPLSNRPASRTNNANG